MSQFIDKKVSEARRRVAGAMMTCKRIPETGH